MLAMAVIIACPMQDDGPSNYTPNSHGEEHFGQFWSVLRCFDAWLVDKVCHLVKVAS